MNISKTAAHAALGADATPGGAIGDPIATARRALFLVVVLCACPRWQRLPCPTPDRYSCVRDQPYVCAPSRELTPVGDEPCSAQGRVCAIDTAGLAYCARAANGGAP